MMKGKLYQGDFRREISFPLGGIGAGCIGLDGYGRLIDWEIFNRPNKRSVNGYSHFAVKAEKNGRPRLHGRGLYGRTALPPKPHARLARKLRLRPPARAAGRYAPFPRVRI